MKQKDIYEVGIAASKIASQNQLTLSQMVILGVIYLNPKISINEISSKCFINRTTCSKAIKNLFEDGWIAKQKDLSDERITRYTRTERELSEQND